MIRLVTVTSCKPYPTIIWFILSQVIMLFHISTGHRPVRIRLRLYSFMQGFGFLWKRKTNGYTYSGHISYILVLQVYWSYRFYSKIYIFDNDLIDIDCTTEFEYQHEHLNFHESIYILHCSFYFLVKSENGLILHCLTWLE